MNEKLQYSVAINAPKEKVWHTMLDDKTYREWTAEFNPGSYYEGDRNQGSKIRFLGPNPEDPTSDEIGGMYGEIETNRPYEFVSIRYLGMIEKGQITEGAPWAGAHENYTFSEKDGVTMVDVEIDATGDANMDAMFNDMRPKALQKLKGIAEA